MSDSWIPPRPVTQRVAVDIPGEAERIRSILVRVDHLARLTRQEARTREAHEGLVPAGRSGLLTDSPRLTCLDFAADSLEQALEQLLAAYTASSAVTDEEPF